MAILSVLLLSLVLTSCQGTAYPSLVGSWKGTRPVRDGQGQSSGLYLTASQLKLTINADDTFTMEDAGLPKTGDVEYQDKLAYLHVKTMLGRPISEAAEGTRRMNAPIKLTPQPDGSLEFFDPEGFDDKPIDLKRISSPNQP